MEFILVADENEEIKDIDSFTDCLKRLLYESGLNGCDTFKNYLNKLKVYQRDRILETILEHNKEA